MKVFYRDGGSSGVIKPVERAYAEEEDHRAVEDEEEHHHCDHAHQGHCGEVTLAVENRTKGGKSVGRIATVVEYATICLSLQKQTRK